MTQRTAFPQPAPHKTHWLLDPEVVFLNHGSFGACPSAVLAHQAHLREQMERRPIDFFLRDLEDAIEHARERVASFLRARPENLLFVENATEGVNTALRAIDLSPGDEILVTDHEYGASRNALDVIARERGATVVTVNLPFPISSPDEVLSRIEDAITPRTRLLLIDHITSKTALVLPLEAILAMTNARGIDSVVDGAHAPGMIPLDLESLGATYYTGNCHKWLCSPKSCAILHAREDRALDLSPIRVSHGESATQLSPLERLRFQFGWPGTRDPSPLLCVPRALDVMGSFFEEGWPALMAHNRELALQARAIVCEALEVDVPTPDAMIGAIATIPLPPRFKAPPSSHPLYRSPLQDALLATHRIELPFAPAVEGEGVMLRLSAQLHNHLPEYDYLAGVLPDFLESFTP